MYNLFSENKSADQVCVYRACFCICIKQVSQQVTMQLISTFVFST